MMNVVTVISSGLALSVDNFAVAAVVTASLPRPTAWHALRLTMSFGVFQSVTTLVGCVGGIGLSTFIGETGYWISLGLLTLLGMNMLRDQSEKQPTNDLERPPANSYDPTKGWSIVGLSFACALDSLVAGFSLSLMGTETWELAPIFGATAALMAFIGTRIGARASLQLGAWPQRLGGFVLIGIGIRGAIQHLIWG